MAPECVEVYLRWILEFCLENLNPLRPLQDLPSLQEKIESKVTTIVIFHCRLYVNRIHTFEEFKSNCQFKYCALIEECLGKFSKYSTIFEKLNQNFRETQAKFLKLNENIAETQKYEIFSCFIKLKGVPKKPAFVWCFLTKSEF